MQTAPQYIPQQKLPSDNSPKEEEYKDPDHVDQISNFVQEVVSRHSTKQEFLFSNGDVESENPDQMINDDDDGQNARLSALDLKKQQEELLKLQQHVQLSLQQIQQ